MTFPIFIFDRVNSAEVEKTSLLCCCSLSGCSFFSFFCHYFTHQLTKHNFFFSIRRSIWPWKERQTFFCSKKKNISVFLLANQPIGSSFIRPQLWLAITSNLEEERYRVYQGFRLNLGKRGEMIISGSLLTTVEVRSIFRGSQGMQ